jgi:small-conductance mechanosensitive channel
MYGYDEIIDLVAIQNIHMRVEHWLLTQVLVWSTLGQAGALLSGLVAAFFLSKPLTGRLRSFISQRPVTDWGIRLLANAAMTLAFPVIAIVTLSAMLAVAAALRWPHVLLSTGVHLLAVWIVIRLTSVLIQNETWARVIAVAAFAVATLNILDLLQPTILFLDGIGIRMGGIYLSVLDVLRGAIQLVVLLWLAFFATRLLEQRMRRARTLTPSLQLLTGKLLKFTLVAIAVVFVLTSIGIDLTALAVFTGAVGVGIGFGLQKPISNLISGIILLLDRSIKPGDVVELSDPSGGGERTFGWVTALNARYASLTTRDGKEWLVPNEDLITQRVINWSFTNDRLRLLTPLGISYDSDVRKAMELAVEAARESQRVLRDPPPVCRLMGFGESSVDLELRIWIRDPANGVVNIRSEVLLAVWDKFHENDIRIPFAQRDLHIKDDSELTVTLNRAKGPAAA